MKDTLQAQLASLIETRSNSKAQLTGLQPHNSQCEPLTIDENP